MKKPQPTSIESAVMSQIKGGKVRMKPRVLFTLLTLSGVGAVLAGGVLMAYVISILTYNVRIETAATPAYGARQNLSDALASFPWWAVAAAALFGALGIWLLRRHSHMYRYPLGLIIGAFLLLSTFLGIGLSFAGFAHPEPGTRQPAGQHQPGQGGGRYMR